MLAHGDGTGVAGVRVASNGVARVGPATSGVLATLVVTATVGATRVAPTVGDPTSAAIPLVAVAVTVFVGAACRHGAASKLATIATTSKRPSTVPSAPR